jgi:hypothetical protein
MILKHGKMSPVRFKSNGNWPEFDKVPYMLGNLKTPTHQSVRSLHNEKSEPHKDKFGMGKIDFSKLLKSNIHKNLLELNETGSRNVIKQAKLINVQFDGIKEVTRFDERNPRTALKPTLSGGGSISARDPQKGYFKRKDNPGGVGTVSFSFVKFLGRRKERVAKS